MNKYVRLDEVRRAVLHNEGQAVIAAIDDLKTFNPHDIMRDWITEMTALTQEMRNVIARKCDEYQALLDRHYETKERLLASICEACDTTAEERLKDELCENCPLTSLIREAFDGND